MSIDAADQQLREILDEAVTKHGRVSRHAPFTSIIARADQRRRRHRAGLGVGALVLLLAAGTTAALLSTGDNRQERRLDTVAPDRSPQPAAPSAAGLTFTDLPGSPLAVRADAALVWTGNELVVWGGNFEAANMGLPGGNRSYADGAAYDPSTRRWRMMSQGPLPVSDAQATAVMVDAGVIITRGTATALWDPREDTWRELARAPRPVHDLASTGHGVLSYSANASLDVATGGWTDLPEPPLQLERPVAVWAGAELVVIGGPGTPFTTAAVIAYAPATGAWRTGSPAPEDLPAAALAADWDGERVIVVNYDMRAATYDPVLDAWSDLPSVPSRFSEFQPSLQTVGGTPMAFMSMAIALLDDDDTWIPVPYPTGGWGESVTTDEGAVLVWKLDANSAENRLLAMTRDADLSAVQVGLGAVPVPDSYQVSDTSGSGEATDTEDVRVVLSADSGDSCTITSSYRGMGGPGLDQPVPETLQSNDVPTRWLRSEDDRTWQTDPTTSDRFEISCDDAQVARNLAQNASLLSGP